MREYIDAAAFKEMMLCADAALSDNIQIINDLNVFPVPDGDTGTNMSLTMNSAAAELRKKSFDAIDAAASCVASALLRGARGNSGVILSLLFRGISRRLKGIETAGAAEFAGALSDGVDAAYKAVMKPAEGTILTVSRLAAAAAVEAANAGASLESALECAIRAGEETLEDTVNLNPVLKKAGVVDAGGMGFMTILKAMLASLRGEVTAPVSAAKPKAQVEEKTAFEVFDTEDITFAFDTVYIVRKNDPDVDLDPLRAYLNSIGDSLVIGEDDESFKVHVHTNIPGDALNESQKYGTLELAKIENMRTQHDDILAGKKAQTTDDLEQIEAELEAAEHEEKIAAPEKEYGVVAVCAGAGMEALFQELGADAIVTGGQTMNPSTNDILKEINRTPASTVFVFPNNKNIIMAAEQAINLADREVRVLPTRTIPEGLSAMLVFDESVDAEQNQLDMTKAAERVSTGQVTFAARDSEYDGHKIREGEILAIENGKVTSVEKDIIAAAVKVTKSMVKKHRGEASFITIIYGEDATEEQAAQVEAEIREKVDPDIEVAIVDGGTPIYYFTISVE